jgi:hypothetical protein
MASSCPFVTSPVTDAHAACRPRELDGIRGREAEAVHARVELEMNPSFCAGRRRPLAERAHDFDFLGGDFRPRRDGGECLRRKDSAEHGNAGFGKAQRPQRRRFLDRDDSEVPAACFREGFGADGRTVSVRVGLDHREHVDGGADESLHFAEVVRERGGIDAAHGAARTRKIG